MRSGPGCGFHGWGAVVQGRGRSCCAELPCAHSSLQAAAAATPAPQADWQAGIHLGRASFKGVGLRCHDGGCAKMEAARLAGTLAPRWCFSAPWAHQHSCSGSKQPGAHQPVASAGAGTLVQCMMQLRWLQASAAGQRQFSVSRTRRTGKMSSSSRSSSSSWLEWRHALLGPIWSNDSMSSV